jgi:hypothetical protein
MGGWHLGNFQIRAQIIFPTRRSVSSEQESARALNLRFQPPLPRLTPRSTQGVVAKKLELAETMGLFSFFQNIANAVLLAAWYKIRLFKNQKNSKCAITRTKEKKGGRKKK